MYQQNMVRPVITIYSKGKLSDNVISEFVNDLEEIGQILLVTDNIFGIKIDSVRLVFVFIRIRVHYHLSYTKQYSKLVLV